MSQGRELLFHINDYVRNRKEATIKYVYLRISC